MVRLYQKLFAQFNIRATGIILLFVQDAVLINYFGKVFFGEFVFFASLIQIIAIIGVCGQNNFIVFLSSKYKKCSQPSLIPHAVILGVLVALIGTIFLSLIVMVLNYMVFHKSEVSLPLVFVTSAMFGVFEVVRQTFRTISKEGITDSLSLICVPSTVIIVTLFFSFFDIDYLLDHPDYLYSFAVFVVLIITVVIFISEKPGFKDLPLKEFRKPFANSVSMNRLRLVWFKRGVPLTVSGLFTTFQQRIDVVILGVFINSESLAIYQILSRFSLLALFFLRSIQSVVLAPFATMILDKSYKSASKILRRSVMLSSLGAVLSYIVVILSEPAIPYLFSFNLGDFKAELLMLFFARGTLAASGGAPLLLQMTFLRKNLPIILVFSIVLFFFILFYLWIMSGEIKMLGMAFALLIFNGVYGLSSYLQLRNFLKFNSHTLK